MFLSTLGRRSQWRPVSRCTAIRVAAPQVLNATVRAIWEELKNRAAAQFLPIAHRTIRITESTVRMHPLAVAAT